MNWVRWVARRYLKAKKNTRFLSLSTSLSMGGIGLGVAAIIVVLSVMKGFELQLKDKLISSELHILIQPKSTFPGFDQGMIPLSQLDSLPAYASMQSNAEVNTFSPMLSSEVILRMEGKVSGVMLKGAGEAKIKSISEQLTDKALPQMMVDRDEGDGQRMPGIFVGRELADDLGLIPGDIVTAISPSMMDGPFSNIPRMKRFVVEGIYRFGSPEQEMHLVYTSIANMESFIRRKAMVTEVEVTLKDASRARNFLNQYQPQMPDLGMKDWYDLNSSLFASMKLERIAMFMILLFTVMIASLNIVSTLTLMVQEKIKEVTILRVMGSTSKNNRTMPVSFEWEYFIGVPLVSFLIVMIASWFPARKAAEITPIEGIRGA